MSIAAFDLYTILCYGFLFGAVLLLWAPLQKVVRWETAFLGALFFGVLSTHVEWMGVGVIVGLAGCIYITYQKSLPCWIRFLSGTAAFFLGSAIGFHQIPGFSNLKVLNAVYLSPDAVPFTMYLNFDKVSLGLMILGFTPLLVQNNKWRDLFKRTFLKAFFVIVMIAGLSYGMGFVTWDFKVPDSLWIWALTNLLFVCVAEEAFFRGFVQRNLFIFLENTAFRSFGAIVIAGLVFGGFHYYGGVQYMILSAIAGMGYGWIYQTTGRIEASILTHFSLNLIHFLCFTYPALKTVF
ncbi:MAG: hypothetical protein B7Y25_08255 [Alphaproteobacteria bacterium 16-39-46]|nr:MAG: hypothetical protein B7Y25_08255 [Alphaproteobacteria bacterium 16-39-46]OZA41172.1 MAG: hypothetical protein B7X84_08475 [Alphaproteobacteria bacterium 17-39-52]HQS84875.1 type II CAAX endopeptidase family protein [Alphaproteobacteria bacterium]HQS94649.1 type II CAAX endopeptidase family protein [Alphaproteobacteria bacterium]